MSRIVIFLVLFTSLAGLSSERVAAQFLHRSATFSLGSPHLEPEAPALVAGLPDGELVALAKVEGGVVGSSSYRLECYGSSLQLMWATDLQLSGQEEVHRLFFNHKEVVLLLSEHDLPNHKARLKAIGFEPLYGQIAWRKELVQAAVGAWANPTAFVRESFEELCAASGQPDFTTPVTYQFTTLFSPDQHLMLTGLFDYSQPELRFVGTLFDRKLAPLRQVELPVAPGLTHHELALNDEGDMFMANADSKGALWVMHFPADGTAADSMQLAASSEERNDFRIHLDEARTLQVAAVNRHRHQLTGITLARFNFETREIQENVVALSDEMKRDAGTKDWRHVELVEWKHEADGDSYLMLEKRFVEGPGLSYEGLGIRRPDRVAPGKLQALAEGVLVIAVDQTGRSHWQRFIAKIQQSCAADGLNTLSFVSDVSTTETVRLLFAEAEEGAFAHVRLWELDKVYGDVARETRLFGEGKMALLRRYVYFAPDGSFVIGVRKGAVGESSQLLKYREMIAADRER
ncbi:hypothetical protein SAMN05421823_108180 [Catalinimonas alkaloidigena]|uniref:Uncharacterized protein n=1 Tax=Catalinimonas alkaloidigena TaxID=1075417 RepID=A0A1G9N5E3_9BACT|nr:hypothetical protein [Catalinimonas alkaloidigena]SDL81521.1 hypothetical protein SAMN05421823_108180 [Catalinimonas alkaloidigena]